MAPAAPALTPLHRERLWPSVGTWLLVGVAGLFGAATGFLGGTVWIVGCAVGLAAFVAVWLVSTSARVEVGADGVLRVGSASVEVTHVTGAMAGRGERARALRGPLLDARTHLCLRGWVDPVVLVGLGDPDDPTPSWLFSTRHPEGVVAALAELGVSGPVTVHRAPTLADADEGVWPVQGLPAGVPPESAGEVTGGEAGR